jgi:hypothetical protein
MMDAKVKRFNDGLLELDRMSLSLENLVIVMRDSHDERITGVIEFIAARIRRAGQQIRDAIGPAVGETSSRT